MIALVQRVARAHVEVAGVTVGAVAAGALVLVCAEPADTSAHADRLVAKLLALRIFADAAGKMNLNLQDMGGGLLLVPQFTLAADTQKGLRPSFTSAADPAIGRSLFEAAVRRARHVLGTERVATGEFGAHMQVRLTNDGPVTLLLDSDKTF